MAHLGPHPMADSKLHRSPGRPSPQGMWHANPSTGRPERHPQKKCLAPNSKCSQRKGSVRLRDSPAVHRVQRKWSVCVFSARAHHSQLIHTPHTLHAQHTNTQPNTHAAQHTQDIPPTHIYTHNTTQHIQHNLHTTQQAHNSTHNTQTQHSMQNTHDITYLYTYNTIYITQHIHTFINTYMHMTCIQYT